MFATSIFCDKCGIGLQFSSIEPKWFVVKRQESTDGASERDIYALGAERRKRNANIRKTEEYMQKILCERQ